MDIEKEEEAGAAQVTVGPGSEQWEGAQVSQS